eukprot:g4835.t1
MEGGDPPNVQAQLAASKREVADKKQGTEDQLRVAQRPMAAALKKNKDALKAARKAAAKTIKDNQDTRVWGGNPALYMRDATPAEKAQLTKSAEGYVVLVGSHATSFAA